MCTEQADPDCLPPHPWASQSQNRCGRWVAHPWASPSQNNCGRWVVAGQPINKQLTETGSICDSTEVVEEAKLPCPVGFRRFGPKENNRCSFKEKTHTKNKTQIQTPNIILLHNHMPVNSWRIRTFFASPHRASGRQTQRRVCIFLISVTFPWWTPESVRHCLGMLRRGALKACTGFVQSQRQIWDWPSYSQGKEN